jgi:hypothetical protein
MTFNKLLSILTTRLTRNKHVSLELNTSLRNERTSTLINEIDTLVSLPIKHFRTLYERPIHRYLSATPQKYHGKILTTVIKNLKLRRAMILPPETDAEKIKSNRDTWTYVVFISSLLLEANKLVSLKKIIDEKDYKTSSESQLDRVTLSRNVNVMLLPVLFDQKCLSWLIKDIFVFDALIELLAGVHTKNKELQSLFSLEDQDENTSVFASTSALKNNDGSLNKFLTWLIGDMALDISCSYMCKTTEGYALATPEVFKNFSSGDKEKWPLLKERFLRLNIHTEQMVFFGAISKKALIVDPEILKSKIE